MLGDATLEVILKKYGRFHDLDDSINCATTGVDQFRGYCYATDESRLLRNI